MEERTLLYLAAIVRRRNILYDICVLYPLYLYFSHPHPPKGKLTPSSNHHPSYTPACSCETLVNHVTWKEKVTWLGRRWVGKGRFQSVDWGSSNSSCVLRQSSATACFMARLKNGGATLRINWKLQSHTLQAAWCCLHFAVRCFEVFYFQLLS